jgi:hypothetical protein
MHIDLDHPPHEQNSRARDHGMNAVKRVDGGTSLPLLVRICARTGIGQRVVQIARRPMLPMRTLHAVRYRAMTKTQHWHVCAIAAC